jgi:predicted transcriptional regulator
MALKDLSRRERQIMEILYSRGAATAAEVHAAMEDAPSYSAVRAMLRILEDKGHLKHRADGVRYIYAPTVNRESAKRSAVRHMVDTLFAGAADQMVAALLDSSVDSMSPEQLERIAQMIEKAKKEGR